MGGSNSKSDVKTKPKTSNLLKYVTLGLPNAGKSSFLHRLVNGEPPEDFVATIGVDFRILYQDGYKLQAWDFTGRGHFRYVARVYYRGAAGIVYMIDSADVQMLDESLDFLNTIMKDEEISNISIMVVANKQDLDDALSPDVIEDKIKEKCTIGKGISLFVMPMSVMNKDDDSSELAHRLFVKTMLRKEKGKIATGLLPRAWDTAEKEAQNSDTDDMVDEGNPVDEKDNEAFKEKEKDSDQIVISDQMTGKKNKKKSIFKDPVHMFKCLLIR